MLLLRIIRKAFGDTIVDQISHFRETRKKMSEADATLKGLIVDAEKIKQEIIGDGRAMKETIITQAYNVAYTKEKEILEQAEQKAKNILEQAKVKADSMESEIKENYSYLVKQSAGSMVKKLFEKDVAVQEAYMKAVIQDI